MTKSVLLALTASLLASALSSAASAAPPYKAGMTCQEFLSLDTVQQPKVVYWIEGLKHKGKWHDAVVDTVSTDKVVPMVIEECKAKPQASFWQKLDLSWHKFEASVKQHL